MTDRQLNYETPLNPDWLDTDGPYYLSYKTWGDKKTFRLLSMYLIVRSQDLKILTKYFAVISFALNIAETTFNIDLQILYIDSTQLILEKQS